jgi:hypothetical protein
VQVHRVVTDPAPGLSALAELVDPDHPEDLEELIALRNETDEVARTAANEMLSVLPSRDRYVGSHAAVVMAPFMWRSPSRFSPGTFGVLYTAATLSTAVREAAYHAADLLAASAGSPPGSVPRVAIILQLDVSAHFDARWVDDPTAPGGRGTPPGVDRAVYAPADYHAAQQLGATLFAQAREGIRYSSVRDRGGECFGTLRPAAVESVEDEAVTIELIWDGKTVTQYRIVETVYL